MTSALPRLLGAPAFSFAELCAARLDGQLYRVGDLFATIDTADSAELRAEAFAAVTPSSVIADRGTSSWIHGARASPPTALQVCVDHTRRGAAVGTIGLDVRQCALTRGDVIRLGGARTTSPLRTAVDLLRTERRFTPMAALEIAALLRFADASVADCRDRIRRHLHSPGTRRALVRAGSLERMAARAGPAASLLA
jgi:hypothetical protein